MAGIVYFKSALWLVSLGGLGYGLMIVTAPSQATIDEIKEKSSRTYTNEDEKRKELFMKRLQEAASDSRPIYLKSGNKNN